MDEAFDPKELPEWREAAALGVDLQLLEASLRLTPWERVEANRNAVALIEFVETAFRVKAIRTKIAATNS